MKKLFVTALAAGALVILAAPAFAVHEANNSFDMAATTAAPSADATGISNLSSGNDGWFNRISASGLQASTTYDWRGIGGPNNVVICSFTTDTSGSGSCTSDVNSFLGRTEVREQGTQTLVLQATDRQDPDNKVDDGEIERRGTCRDESNSRCEARP